MLILLLHDCFVISYNFSNLAPYAAHTDVEKLSIVALKTQLMLRPGLYNGYVGHFTYSTHRSTHSVLNRRQHHIVHHKANRPGGRVDTSFKHADLHWTVNYRRCPQLWWNITSLWAVFNLVFFNPGVAGRHGVMGLKFNQGRLKCLVIDFLKHRQKFVTRQKVGNHSFSPTVWDEIEQRNHHNY